MVCRHDTNNDQALQQRQQLLKTTGKRLFMKTNSGAALLILCGLFFCASIKAEAANAENCLEIARTGMMAGGQNDICKFNGNLKEKLMELYRAKSCGNLVSAADLNKAAEEILDGMRSEYAQSGKKKFCSEARKYYFGDIKKFYEAQTEAYITGKD